MSRIRVWSVHRISYTYDTPAAGRRGSRPEMEGGAEPPQFANLSNFRRIDGTRLYRSSRPDKLSVADLDKFWSLGLKSVVDLRSMREYPAASGTKLLDDYFIPISVFPERRPGGGPPVVNYNAYSKRGTTRGDITSRAPRYPGFQSHFFVDLLSAEYGWAVFRGAGLLVKLYLAVLYVFDSLFKTNVFVRSLVRYVINADGLYGQYRDILMYAGPKVYTALSLIAIADNCPVLVCCAYGKDRTGVLVAVILRLLGRTQHYIAEDYAKSESEMVMLETELSSTIRQYSFSNIFSTAKYETMIQLLEFIDERYGCIQQYLEMTGIDIKMQRQIIQNLTSTSGAVTAYPRRQSVVPLYR